MIKSKYFKCSVSNVENGFTAGRVCFISFSEKITLDEAREYVFIDNVKYDDFHIVVDYLLEKKIDTFTHIVVNRELIEKKSLSKMTLDELKKEVEIQEKKMMKYNEQRLYHMLSDCAYYIDTLEDEIEKRG